MSLSMTAKPDILTVSTYGTATDYEGDGVAINMVIRQDPFFVTLDATALLAISVLLVTGMHLIDRLTLECLIVLVPVALLIHNDYRNFLKLGPGGTPPTPLGYARLSYYRIFTLRDPFTPPPVDPSQKPSAGILRQNPLPYRPGPRPKVAGLAPQRQLNQPGPAHCYEAAKQTLEQLCARHGQKFVTATSSIEKHGVALFSRNPKNVFGNGEICHIHDAESSLHLNLHPDDIKEVLDKGWGQRHPMAWTGGYVPSPVACTFVLVYAPRNENDLRILCRILEAAIWFITTEKVDVPLATISDSSSA